MSLRVLIVEDSPTQTEALAAALEDGGYVVSMARGGEDALRRLETDAPDIVVSDVVMAGQVDGFELCRRIKAGERHDTPVLLLTSLSDPMDIIRGLEAGADSFLTKPFDQDTLLERLGILMNTRRARQGRREQAGDSVYFRGRELRITSEREQILDLLITTFEDAVRQNRELRSCELELMSAKEQLARFAGMQEQLQDIVDNSPAVVYLKDTNGRYSLVNRQFERLLGVGRREAVGKTDEQLLPAELAAKQRLYDQEVLESGLVREFDVQIPLGSEQHTYLTVKFPLRHSTGETYGVCGISTDISERKRSEESIRVRARQQAAVAELGRSALSTSELPDLIDEAVTLAARTLQVDVSEVFEWQASTQRLLMRAGFGWDGGHVGRTAIPTGSGSQSGYTLTVGEPVIVEDYRSETRFTSPVAHSSGLTSGMTVVIGGRPRAYGVLGVHTREARHFTEDDAYFLQAIANVLAAAIDRDHTDRSLNQSRRLEAVGSLAGGVAHDFNNLLTVISGSSDFALSGLPNDSDVRTDIEEISRAAARAASLTRQLLAFSRRQVLQPVVLDVNQVVQEMGSMMRRLLSADIELKLALNPGLSRVKADPGQLEQVIMNLVVNARDAMPRGGKLLLETGMVELDEAYVEQHVGARLGKHVMIAVTDTGMGMDRQTQARIFEPFFTTKGERGTGLGLATVYGIVKQSGGSIWVYSELEHGTTFKVYLPSVQEAAVARGRDLGPLVGGSETVLLVEDDDAVRQLSARMLSSAGYHVLTASSGMEALEIAAGHQGQVHLLVTDLVMPQMRGSDLAERLMGGHPDLRLLFMSGYTDPAFLEHRLIARGAPFLQKPFSAEALVRKVREVLTAPS